MKRARIALILLVQLVFAGLFLLYVMKSSQVIYYCVCMRFFSIQIKERSDCSLKISQTDKNHSRNTAKKTTTFEKDVNPV